MRVWVVLDGGLSVLVCVCLGLYGCLFCFFGICWCCGVFWLVCLVLFVLRVGVGGFVGGLGVGYGGVYYHVCFLYIITRLWASWLWFLVLFCWV